jgi:hypothetical protein
MKRVTLLLGGICWLLFALGFAVFLLQYVTNGAGASFFGLSIFSGSVALGVFQVVSLAVASLLCFSIGAVMCATGLALKKSGKEAKDAAS